MRPNNRADPLSPMETKTSFLLVALLFVTAAYAGEIGRKTFSVTLPSGWTEDTKSDMYDADSFIFFENPESCLINILIGTKSAGASVAKLLAAQKNAWDEKLTNLESKKIEK